MAQTATSNKDYTKGAAANRPINDGGKIMSR